MSISSVSAHTSDFDIGLLSVSKPSGKVLLLAFILLPFLDNISGAGIGIAGQSISLFFRVVVLIYLFYFAAVLDAGTAAKMLGILAFLFIPIVLRFLADHNYTYLVLDQVRLLKTYYGIVGIFGVYSLLKRDLLTVEQLSSIIAVSAIIYCFWIIGVFGYMILTGTYRGGGSTGIMFAGNDVSHSIAISTPFIYWFGVKQFRSFLVRNLLYVFVAGALFLLFTKSGILGALVLFYLVFRGSSRRTKIAITVAITLVVVFVISMIAAGKGILYELYRVYLVLFQEYGVAGLFFRGRNELFRHLPRLLEETNGIELLFGSGYTRFSTRYAELSVHWVSRLKNAEMDLFDLFFSYGILGGVMIIFTYARYSKYAFMKIEEDIDLRFSLFIFWIHSIFAGHAISTPIVGTYIAAILGLGYYSRLKQNEKPVTASGGGLPGPLRTR